MKNKILSGMMGLCVGDALGVPVEFQSRESLVKHPVTNMRGFGTHNQPPGTWSDDTSMALCLADSLTNGLDYEDIMKKFLSWLNEANYTPHGEIFDVGMTTREAILLYARGESPLSCGRRSEYDNGNGSLMRILPLSFYIFANYGPKVVCNDEMMTMIHNVSSLTHAHERSLIACGIYISIALRLMEDMPIKQAVEEGIKDAFAYYEKLERFSGELSHYGRIYDTNAFAKIPAEQIKSTGYVVDTLEAAIWCLLTTDSYKDCILKAVNLGEDTDTVAAVAGGLAGLSYGYEEIPNEWLVSIARYDWVEKLCEGLEQSLYSKK